MILSPSKKEKIDSLSLVDRPTYVSFTGSYIPWNKDGTPDISAKPRKVTIRLLLTAEDDLKLPWLGKPVKAIALRNRKVRSQPEQKLGFS